MATQVQNLINQKFGRLTVTSRAENSRTGMLRWNCTCECGKKVTVFSNLLKNGNTKSCGCLRGFDDKSLSSKRFIFYTYKKDAKDADKIFLLSFEDFLFLTQQNCTYCGCPPKNFFKMENGRKGFFYNGIDRINNDVGYVSGNMTAACHDCNWAKSNLSKEEFILWIKRCYNHMNSNNMFEGL